MFKNGQRHKRKLQALLRRAGNVTLVSSVVAVVAITAGQAPTVSQALSRAVGPSVAVTVRSSHAAPQGLIAAGPTRKECLEPNFDDTGLVALQRAISGFDAETHSTVTCVSAYLNQQPTWSTWEHPWIDSSQYGYTSWVAKEPQVRQLVLAVSLIPESLKDIKDPLGWEESCAAGDFNAYATVLGTSLVAAGLGDSVIRLGPEMNGIWEDDFVGTTIQEQTLWAQCFDNEVTGLRQATGERFLIDWNPNACVEDLPFANFYPGNAYVDIVGLDLFDVGCESPKTPLTFSQLAAEPAGLKGFEAFAEARGKPMSLPEWGLMPTAWIDDPGYINGIGALFSRQDFAFECYFDANLKIRPYLPLGSRTPRSLAAFQSWFGDGST